MEYIATFATSHAALRAEQACRAEALPVELIPLPSQIRGDCGFCLLLEGDGEAETASRLQRLRSLGAMALYRIRVDQPGPSSRKVKNYERCP